MLSDCSSEQSIKKSTFGSLSMPGQPIRIFSYSDLQSVFLHFIFFPDVTKGPQPFKVSNLQPANLPFQEGDTIDPSGNKQDQELKDLCREILMVRISELHESDDDSMERVNLDDYNSNDYDEYLSDNMETTPPAVTEVKATIKQDLPAAPPAVTVTVQLEVEPAA